MSAATVRIGRPPHRREKLVAELRRQIMCGELLPGSRLPSRHELTRQFNTAIPTVQDAVQSLVRDGFIETQGTRGTFVAQNLPHLCAYGLVLPRLRSETRYFRAVRHAARAVFDSESRRLRLYEPETGNPADPIAHKLIDDVTNHRLAGAILTWPSGEFAGSPLYAPDDRVPLVSIGSVLGQSGVPSLQIDVVAFYERAVERLVQRGRRKIAHVGVGNQRHVVDFIGPILRHHGLEHRPYWHQRIGEGYYGPARAAMHLMFSLAPADRPDGLILSDDNLVEPAQAGLVDAGVRVPADLDVVAHCNWPDPPVAVMPLIRLGYDAIELMRACTRSIDEQRRGEVPTAVGRFGPLFEDELPASSVIAEVEADSAGVASMSS